MHLITHNNMHTLRRTPLEEGSTRRKSPLPVQHNIRSRITSMPQVAFEPSIPASERMAGLRLRPRRYRNRPSQDFPTKIMHTLRSASAQITSPLNLISLHRHTVYNSNYEDHYDRVFPIFPTFPPLWVPHFSKSTFSILFSTCSSLCGGPHFIPVQNCTTL